MVANLFNSSLTSIIRLPYASGASVESLERIFYASQVCMDSVFMFFFRKKSNDRVLVVSNKWCVKDFQGRGVGGVSL